MSTPLHDREKQRVQGTAAETAVKAGPGIVYRVILSDPSGAAASGTCTLRDGTGSGNNVIVLEIAQGESRSIEIGAFFDTSIQVKNSDTDVDVLVVYS